MWTSLPSLFFLFGFLIKANKFLPRSHRDHDADLVFVVMMIMNRPVSLEMDHDSAESTLSNSFDSSVSVESSHGDDADSKMDECDGWTNEKHNSYLDGLENSFVSQLHSFLGGESQRVSRTRDVQSNSRKSTNQLRVLQTTCLKRAHLGTSLEFRFQKTSSCDITGTSVQGNVLCREAFYTPTPQNTAEGRGLNFREEDGNESVSEVTTKRKREAKFDDSSLKDQVVP